MSKEKNYNEVAELSKEDIQAFKQKYGEIKVVEVTGKSGQKMRFAFKPANRRVMDTAMDILLQQRSVVKSSKAIVNSLLLNGKDVYEANDEVYYALNGIAQELKEEAEVSFLPV